MIGTLWLVAAIGITWSLSAIALAVLAYRRVEAGRVGLVVSAVLAAIVGLVAFPVGLLNAAGAVTATVLLLRRPAQEWYAARDRDADGSPPPPPPPAGPAAQQQPPPPRSRSSHRPRTSRASRRSGSQACRSAFRSRCTASSSTAVSLQNAQRTLWRPSSWSS